jgi:hydroxyethylthiazole kinase-like uncharacterized protein yjeF
LLTGIASLRAGAGKLQIATCRSTAIQIGVALPEALVMGLDETKTGSIRASGSSRIMETMKKSHATLIGPGMMDKKECAALLTNLLPDAGKSTVVLDAGALSALGQSKVIAAAAGISGVITPHAGEMAAILDTDIENVEQDPAECAAGVAAALGVVVVLKGADTHIVSPDGERYIYRSGDVGLATSGSGDTLAGIITGLAARGADPMQASVWGVYLHGEAGNVVAKKSGRVGYLARELLIEIPPIMNRLSAAGKQH